MFLKTMHTAWGYQKIHIDHSWVRRFTLTLFMTIRIQRLKTIIYKRGQTTTTSSTPSLIYKCSTNLRLKLLKNGRIKLPTHSKTQFSTHSTPLFVSTFLSSIYRSARRPKTAYKSFWTRKVREAGSNAIQHDPDWNRDKNCHAFGLYILISATIWVVPD